MAKAPVAPVLPPAPNREAKATPRPPRGRRSSWLLVKPEALQRLRSTAKEVLLRQGRENFCQGLSDWLRDTHPDERPMAPHTINNRMRDDAKLRDLLPKGWKQK